MAEQRSGTGVEKSSSLANLNEKNKGGDGDGVSGIASQQLNKNPSQKAGDMTPLQSQKEGSVGSSIRRNKRKSARESEGDQSASPTKRTNSVS